MWLQDRHTGGQTDRRRTKWSLHVCATMLHRRHKKKHAWIHTLRYLSNKTLLYRQGSVSSCHLNFMLPFREFSMSCDEVLMILCYLFQPTIKIHTTSTWDFFIKQSQHKAYHPLAGGQSWPWNLTSWSKIDRVPPLVIQKLHVKFSLHRAY